MTSINSIKLISLPHHIREDGKLVVMETGIVPFQIARIFTVLANKDAVRGKHAHRQCAQFLQCSYGSIEVLCNDGVETKTFILDNSIEGLLIPPGIWAQQTYNEDNSLLTVLCDQPYNENDYIREYSEFKQFSKS